MSTYKRNQEEIFNDFVNVKIQVQGLASIVQNEGVTVSEEELNEWSEYVNKAINDLSRLRLDVFEYYQNSEVDR